MDFLKYSVATENVPLKSLYVRLVKHKSGKMAAIFKFDWVEYG